MTLNLINGHEHPELIAELFSEYTALLIRLMPHFGESLALQNYSEEFAHPEGKYAPPDGRLYIAMADGKPAGCIAMRKLDDERCELKRMYVRPEFRGHHIARTMAQRILSDAAEIGYQRVMLDTEPCLENAIRLYESLGFSRVARYNNSPFDSTIFMQYELQKKKNTEKNELYCAQMNHREEERYDRTRDYH